MHMLIYENESTQFNLSTLFKTKFEF